MAEAQQGGDSNANVDDFDEDDDQTKGGQGGGDNEDDGKGGDNDNRIELKDGKILVDGKEWDAERALNTISTQRKSEATAKKRVDELEREIRKLQNKDKPVDQQLSAERDELRVENSKLQAKLSRQALKSAALGEATNLKFKNPTLAHKLIDPDDVEWEDDEPVNLRQLLRQEAKENPYLLRRGRQVEDEDETDNGADGGAGRGGNSKGGDDMNARIRQMVGR